MKINGKKSWTDTVTATSCGWSAPTAPAPSPSPTPTPLRHSPPKCHRSREKTLQWFLEKDGRRTEGNSDRTIDLFLLRSPPPKQEACLHSGAAFVTHKAPKIVSLSLEFSGTNHITKYKRFCLRNNTGTVFCNTRFLNLRRRSHTVWLMA
jgi:hypothetical protein